MTIIKITIIKITINNNETKRIKRFDTEFENNPWMGWPIGPTVNRNP